jgi:hypothetical protein
MLGQLPSASVQSTWLIQSISFDYLVKNNDRHAQHEMGLSVLKRRTEQCDVNQ